MEQRQQLFSEYINAAQKNYTQGEHSLRADLQNLLKNIAINIDFDILNEPKLQNSSSLANTMGGNEDCINLKSRPDFEISKDGAIIGYIETKKCTSNLDEVLKSDQIKKYKQLTENLILTNYNRFIWLCADKDNKKSNNIVADITLCNNLGTNAKPKISQENQEKLTKLFRSFLAIQIEQIADYKRLAYLLAKRTQVLKQEIKELLQYNSNVIRINALYQLFKKHITDDLSEEKFADTFAQTITYSIFLTKFNLNTEEMLQANNVASHTPSNFPLIKQTLEFVKDLNEVKDENNNYKLKPFLASIFNIINNMDSENLKLNMHRKEGFDDPILHFYEYFLREYDKTESEKMGVYYTPTPIVKCIVSNVNKILINDFSKQEGLATTKIIK